MEENQGHQFMSEGGEMGALTRAKDWSATLLGSPGDWPKSLQTALSIVLHSKFPMFIWWGADLVCFYNDAYRPSLGKEGKHPAILGLPAKEAWAEIWDVIYPLIKQVLEGGEATWSEDQLIPIYRNGTLEDVYWTFSYSRITNDEGKPGGVLVTCVETTEKVLNQQRLAESNDLLRFATEAAELGTWDFNPQTQKFKGNARLKSWFGLAPGEETDLQIAMNSIAPKDKDRVGNAITASLDFSIQAPYDIEYTIIHPQSRVEKVVLVRGKTFFNEEGIAYRFSGTMEDITEKDIAKKLREEAEQNLHNLVEQSPVAMCILKGPKHVVEIANERMINLWGKTQDEVMHRPIFEGLPEAQEQGLEQLLDNVYTTGERFTAQERPVNLPRENGIETVYQNFVYQPLIGNDGQVDGVIAVTIDVTEQVLARHAVEEAEARARLAIEAGNLGTFDFNVHTKKLNISPRFYEIFEVDETETQEEIVKHIYSDDQAIRSTQMEIALVTGKIFYEVRIQRKDGGLKWARVEGKITFDEHHKPLRMLGTAMDITDIKDAEQKREEYIAIASHELKNPLTSLRMSLELLSMDINDPDRELFLSKSKVNLERIIKMSEEFLNVSKISAGMLDLKPEVFNLQQCINESITTSQAGVGTNPIKVTGTADVDIRGDKFRIEQVLNNLISNASKYSSTHSPIIIHAAAEPGFIRITVKDKGIGIDKEKIPFVFKKFSRLESTEGIKGYGLGLYISKQIIIKHGGQIGVNSEKDKGSEFWFTLPY